MKTKEDEEIFVCTYDNPSSMRRECWQNGTILYSYYFTLIIEIYSKKGSDFPSRLFFFGANIGPWKEGQLVGDKKAMEKL